MPTSLLSKTHQISVQSRLKQAETDYRILSETPDETSDTSYSRRKTTTIRIFTLAFLVLGAVPFSIFSFSRWFKHQDCNCGNSVQEALANGCKYDPMATSWLPPICRDDELIDEFNHAGPGTDGEWTYYADQSGNRTMTVEEVSRLAEMEGDEATFWTTHEWHLVHCLFYWKKESRARKSGKMMLEKSFDGGDHIDHCYVAFQSGMPLQMINTRSSAGLNADKMD